MIDFPIGNSLTTADYTGAASIYFDKQDFDAIKKGTSSGEISDAAASAFDSSMDYSVISAFFIDAVGFDMADKYQLVEYFGDTFSNLYFGRDPLIISCTGKLSALIGSNTKRNFMALYRDVLRLRKVAKSGIVPILSFSKAIAKGAFIDLQLERTTQINDFYNIAFKFLVFQLLIINTTNKSGITQLDIRFGAVN